MKRSLVAAIVASLAIVASCDQAGPPPENPRAASPIDNGWPPLRYRGDLTIRVQFTAPEKMAEACGVGPNYKGQRVELEACTRLRQNGDHVMILVNPCHGPAGNGRARIECHEIGHVLGWPADHGA